jgi:ATP-binding cassette, subfamily C (CFTR/MRP), member 1
MVLWTSAVQHHGNSVNNAYLAAFVAFGVITLVAVLGVALEVFTYMVPSSARTLHERLLGTVFDAPLFFFTSTHTGQTLNRFSQDLSLVDSEMPMSLIQVTGPLCLALIQVVFISISAAYFAAMLPVIIGVLYLLQNYYLRTSKQIRILDIEAKAPLFSHFLESMQGLVTIRAFGWSNEFAERQTALLDKSQRPFYLMYCIQRWLALVLDLIVAVLAVIFMVMIVKLRDQVNSGFVALALLNIMSLNNNLTAIIQMWTGLENSMGAIARLRDFDRSTPSESTRQAGESVSQSWPANGAIEFTDFSAAYSPESANVLSDLTLHIRQGERIGICGATGSGKSSLIASLFRMLSTTNGSIVIDGVDIATLPVQLVRERITAIPQAAFLLNNSSIRANIDPMSQATDGAIEDSLKQVGLWDVLIASFPSSNNSLDIDTPINLAQTLSQGQTQLFCLARALLHPPTSIVVMDEVSASVDVQTEQRMQAVMKERFAGKTLLVVAHRLATIRDFDRVAVMDAGRIVEVGEPGALLGGREGEGWFRRLWEA